MKNANPAGPTVDGLAAELAESLGTLIRAIDAGVTTKTLRSVEANARWSDRSILGRARSALARAVAENQAIKSQEGGNHE